MVQHVQHSLFVLLINMNPQHPQQQVIENVLIYQNAKHLLKHVHLVTHIFNTNNVEQICLSSTCTIDECCLEKIDCVGDHDNWSDVQKHVVVEHKQEITL